MFTTGHAPLPPPALTSLQQRRDASAADMVLDESDVTATDKDTLAMGDAPAATASETGVGWIEKATLNKHPLYLLSTATMYPSFVTEMTNKVQLANGVVLPLKQRSIHWSHPSMPREGLPKNFLVLQPITLALAQEQERERVEALLMQLNLVPLPMPVSPVILTLTRGEWDAWIDSFGQLKMLLYLKFAATKLATDLHSAEKLKKKKAFYRLMEASVQNKLVGQLEKWIASVIDNDLDITSDELCTSFLQLQREMTFRLIHTLEYQVLDLFELPHTGKDGGTLFLTPTGYALDASVIEQQLMPARRYHEMIRNIAVSYTLKWQFYSEDARRHYPAGTTGKWPTHFFKFDTCIDKGGWIPNAPLLQGWMHKHVLVDIMRFYINVYRNEAQYRPVDDDE